MDHRVEAQTLVEMGASEQHEGGHAAHVVRRDRAAMALGRPGATKPGRSVIGSVASGSPKASAAGAQPEPSTTTARCRGTPVSSARRSRRGPCRIGVLHAHHRRSRRGGTLGGRRGDLQPYERDGLRAPAWRYRVFGRSEHPTEKVNIMRATLDKLISWTGLLLAVMLIVAGGLLTWASTFINNEVTSQLTAQHVTMPTTETGLSDLPAADQAALKPLRRPEADHRSPGPGLRRPLHRRSPERGVPAARPTPRSVASTSSSAPATPRPLPPRHAPTSAGQRQTMFRVRPSAVCCSTATRSPPWARSPASAPSPPSSARRLMLLLVGIGFWHSRRAATT